MSKKLSEEMKDQAVNESFYFLGAAIAHLAQAGALLQMINYNLKGVEQTPRIKALLEVADMSQVVSAMGDNYHLMTKDVFSEEDRTVAERWTMAWTEFMFEVAHPSAKSTKQGLARTPTVRAMNIKRPEQPKAQDFAELFQTVRTSNKAGNN